MNALLKNTMIVTLTSVVFGFIAFCIGFMVAQEVRDWVGIIYGIFGFGIGFILSSIFLLCRCIARKNKS